jgi:hypothetical protein
MCSLYLRSLIDASRNVQGRVEVFANVSVGVDRKRTLWRGGALKVCDVRLFEDGGELGGTLVSDVVVL